MPSMEVGLYLRRSDSSTWARTFFLWALLIELSACRSVLKGCFREGVRGWRGSAATMWTTQAMPFYVLGMYKKAWNRSDEGSYESNAQPVSRAVYIGDKHARSTHKDTYVQYMYVYSPAHLTSKNNKAGSGNPNPRSRKKGAFGHWSGRKCIKRVAGKGKKRQRYCQRQQMNLIW